MQMFACHIARRHHRRPPRNKRGLAFRDKVSQKITAAVNELIEVGLIAEVAGALEVPEEDTLA